jgi:Domain of unknown function (DUF5753)/Helix-turn-helix domain
LSRGFEPHPPHDHQVPRDGSDLQSIDERIQDTVEDREPTVRSRELGAGLRRVMEGCGFHASGIARELAWSPSRVSRILSGKRGGSSHDVAAFIAVCGVRGPERERLMALSLDHGPNWVVHHDPAVPRRSPILADHERHAISIGAYHAGVIPDLLQTPAYASAVLEVNPIVPKWDVPDRVAALAERQLVLDHGNPPDCDFVIHESALNTSVGGVAVMSEQLHALLRWSVRPTISIRIVPQNAGVHAGIAGAFSLLNVRDFKRIVIIETVIASHFIETPAEVSAYQTLLRHLGTVTLDEHYSRKLIAKVATSLSVP